jgi:hypothetical protein
MVMAYEAGASYAIIFNYPSLLDNPYGIMTDEHFEALEVFWFDIMTEKISHGLIQAGAVLVLPQNYGWGMRHPEDRIW